MKDQYGSHILLGTRAGERFSQHSTLSLGPLTLAQPRPSEGSTGSWGKHPWINIPPPRSGFPALLRRMNPCGSTG